MQHGTDRSFFLSAEGVDIAAAAGLPVAFGTAHLALTERAKLQAGQILLVLGAAGGVGVAAVQVSPVVLSRFPALHPKSLWGYRVLADANVDIHACLHVPMKLTY